MEVFFEELAKFKAILDRDNKEPGQRCTRTTTKKFKLLQELYIEYNEKIRKEASEEDLTKYDGRILSLLQDCQDDLRRRSESNQEDDSVFHPPVNSTTAQEDPFARTPRITKSPPAIRLTPSRSEKPIEEITFPQREGVPTTAVQTPVPIQR